MQSKSLKNSDLDSFFVTVCQGILFTLLFVLSTPYITSFYGITELSNILLLLSVSILFYSINTVPNSLNRRQKNLN